MFGEMGNFQSKILELQKLSVKDKRIYFNFSTNNKFILIKNGPCLLNKFAQYPFKIMAIPWIRILS